MTVASTKNVDTSYYGPSPNDTSYNAPSNNDPFNSQKTPIIQVSTKKNSAIDQSSKIQLQPDSNRITKNTKRKESHVERKILCQRKPRL